MAGGREALFGSVQFALAVLKLGVLAILFLGPDLQFLLQPSDLGLLLFELGCVFLVLLLQLELEGLLLG